MQFMRSLLKGVIQQVEIVVAKTTSGASTTGVDMGAYDGTALVILESAAGTGTNPTMDVKVQHCDTVDGTYADITGATFDQVDDTEGGSVQAVAIDLSAAKQFIKVYYTIAGTTPSFTCGVSIVAFPKGS